MSAKMALTSDGGWAAPADAELMHELLGLMATDKVRAAFALSFDCFSVAFHCLSTASPCLFTALP